MSEEVQGTESQANEGGAHAEDMVPKSELTKVIGQRQDLKAKLREYEARFAQEESAKVEAQEAAMRAQGENEKIITARDARIAELEAEIANRDRAKRFGATVEAVSKKAGLSPTLTRALLLNEELSGADVALEEVTDEAVTDLAKALRKSAPELFVTQGNGGSPSAPGLRMSNKDDGEGGGNKWFAAAQRDSAHNKRKA